MNWEAYGASGSPWAITTLQVVVVLLGGWGASIVLSRIYWSVLDKDKAKTPYSWRLPAILITIGYTWLFIAG